MCGINFWSGSRGLPETLGSSELGIISFHQVWRYIALVQVRKLEQRRVD